MVSLAFIFCWRKHIFLLIIQKEPFLYDNHNLLKKNPINTKMSKNLFQNYSKRFLSFFGKFGYVTSNGIEW